MSIIDDALGANATLAADYDASNSGRPAPKIAIVTCADPRLSGFPAFCSSSVSATRVLGTREIMIINHNECGLTTFTDDELEKRLRDETGISPIAPSRFYSFTDAEQNTREQIEKTRSHPWISSEVPVRGFVFDVHTGRLSEVLPRETAVGAAR
jgi:carbonic anhydrase